MFTSKSRSVLRFNQSLIDDDLAKDGPVKVNNRNRKREKRRTLRTVVFSSLFLTIGFCTFLIIMHNFGLLNKKPPRITAAESPTFPKPPAILTEPSTPATTRSPPTTIRTTTTEQQVPRTGNCALGYTKFVKTGFCYKFFNHRTNFDGAREVCMSEDGELASIHSEEENNFLAALVKDDKKVHTNRGVLEEDNEIWIGLHYDEGNWRWVDGTPVDYTKWADGGPIRMTAQPEVTMVVSRITGYSPEGKHWHNAKKSSTQKGLICKKAPI